MTDSRYQAPWWLPGGHLQTIWAASVARRPRVRMRTEHWRTPDGDTVRADFVDGPSDSPLVVMWHGLEGGFESQYVRALAAETRRIGWRFVVPHWRGCGGVASEMPRAYHSGDSHELAWMVDRARASAAGAPLFGVGVSLGGNVLLKWLGEEGAAARAWMRAAVAVSAPLDLAAGGDALHRGFSRAVYARMFLRTMRPKALAKLERHPRLFDAARLARARTLRDFDDVFTAPLHGFRDAADYYARASSKPLLGGIAIPTLVLNARNDPFLPGRHLPGPAEVSEMVRLEYPVTGGHVGFVSGPFPGHLQWLPLRIIGFFRAALDAHPAREAPSSTPA